MYTVQVYLKWYYSS